MMETVAMRRQVFWIDKNRNALLRTVVVAVFSRMLHNNTKACANNEAAKIDAFKALPDGLGQKVNRNIA